MRWFVKKAIACGYQELARIERRKERLNASIRRCSDWLEEMENR